MITRFVFVADTKCCDTNKEKENGTLTKKSEIKESVYKYVYRACHM